MTSTDGFLKHWRFIGFFVMYLWTAAGASGLNYLDYANLFDGEVHLNGAKLAGRASFVSSDQTWKAWEFLGVRYATAERFQPPKFYDDYSLESYEQVKSFTVPGAACVQPRSSHVFPEVNLNKTSEDCLFLNIHLPPVNQEQTLLKTDPWPVLIFIHGGEFQGGSGNNFDGGELAQDIETVVVILNYRVGAFGFLTTENFSAKGNWGLKDVIMAVKWVRRHISRFGADQAKIVLAGHGSGSALASLALMDQSVRDILSGVILMSGSALNQKYVAESPRRAAVELGKSCGCPVESMPNLIACLHNKSVQQILQASAALATKKSQAAIWLPTIDGDLIPYEPQWILRSSAWKFNASILQGFVTHSLSADWPTLDLKEIGALDGNHTTSNEQEQQRDEAREILAPLVYDILRCNVSDEAIEKVQKHYMKHLGPEHEIKVLNKAIQTIMFDAKARLPIYTEAAEFAGNAKLIGEPHSYQLYRLASDEMGSINLLDNRSFSSGLAGMADVAYLFGGRLAVSVLGPQLDDQREGVTAQMRHLMGSFIKQGRAYGTPFDLKNGWLLKLGRSQKWEVTKDPSISATVSFWNNLRTAECNTA